MNPYFELTETGDSAFAVEGTPLKFGPGVLAEVGEDARSLGMTRVAVFTDPAVARLEPVATVVKSLRAAGMDAVVYDKVVVEPTDASFKAGARFAAEGQFDGFVSVGGGSVMDTCKASNLYATYPVDDFMVYVNAPIGAARPVPGPLKSHIACPTTFGTASECTTIAICDFLEMEFKSGIVSKRLRASLGVLDPTALYTLPPMVIAANGFDVLTHAIESYTARPFTKRPKAAIPNQRPQAQGANPYSDIACLEAIRIAGRYLVQAVTDRSDRTVFEPLMFAGMLAGIGFGNAGCHLAHGMSCAVSGLVRDYRAPGYPSYPPDGATRHLRRSQRTGRFPLHRPGMPGKASSGANVLALDNCSLEIEAGEFCVIVGPSGCGKTTLLNAIAGFHDISSGQIDLDGQPLCTAKRMAEPGADRIVVFQQGALFPWYTVLENVVYGPEVQGKMSKAEARQQAESLLAQMGLKGIHNCYPNEISSGMSRRVEIARAMKIKQGDPKRQMSAGLTYGGYFFFFTSIALFIILSLAR